VVDVVHTAVSFQTRDGITAAAPIFMRAESYFASRSGLVTRAPSAAKSCSARARFGPDGVPARPINGSRHAAEDTASRAKAAMRTEVARRAPATRAVCVSRVLDRTKSVSAGRN
jgi:hypothetical protein